MSTANCVPYPRFQISGVNLGLYVFELNPSNYIIYPARNTQYYKAIINSDPSVDGLYNKIAITMNWDWMSEVMWMNLETFARKNVDGTDEGIYFWDANYGRFNGTQIFVDKLMSQAKGGSQPQDLFSVQMTISQHNLGSTNV